MTFTAVTGTPKNTFRKNINPGCTVTATTTLTTSFLTHPNPGNNAQDHASPGNHNTAAPTTA